MGLLCFVLIYSGCSGGADSEEKASQGSEVEVDKVNQVLAQKYAYSENLNEQIDKIGGRIQIKIDLSWTKLTDNDLAALNFPKRLTELNLSGTAITDAGIVHLKSAEHLHDLSLMNTKVTEACFEDLKAMPKLQMVNLHATKIPIKKQRELLKHFRSRGKSQSGR